MALEACQGCVPGAALLLGAGAGWLLPGWGLGDGSLQGMSRAV